MISVVSIMISFGMYTLLSELLAIIGGTPLLCNATLLVSMWQLFKLDLLSMNADWAL